MSRGILRDRAGRTIGSITTERIASGARETLLDAGDRLLGRWESGADETRDAAGCPSRSQQPAPPSAALRPGQGGFRTDWTFPSPLHAAPPPLPRPQLD